MWALKRLRFLHRLAQTIRSLCCLPPSVIRMRFRTVNIDCKAEGIANFQAAYIHWYRQLPDKAPERLLYVTPASQIIYDSESYRNKYSSYKRENNICTLLVNSIQDGDAGTYYCAYWE
uniref:Ig-like domain-containing protein n=1 Tax=Meleagris gallopavo TaxID=9103 RepID=A0A803XYE3_MELGA